MLAWQTSGYHSRHPVGTRASGFTSTRNCKSIEEEQRVMRLFQWWAMEGLSLPDKSSHGLVKVGNGSLPAMDELDVIRFDAYRD